MLTLSCSEHVDGSRYVYYLHSDRDWVLQAARTIHVRPWRCRYEDAQIVIDLKCLKIE